MHNWDWDYIFKVIAFCLIASFKNLRLLVNCFAYWSYRPIPLSCDPVFTPQDVTVVIPSLDGDGDHLRETLRSCLLNDPAEIILVTIDVNLPRARRLAESLSKKITVYSISQANKRRQMCRALPHVSTKITIFADDDVLWPSTLIPWMLAPFEDPEVGGVGTSQRLRREQQPNFWNFLGAAYLIRRNWDIISCNNIDGGLPCLSGRTVAYRTHILQDPEFNHAFTHETWRSFQLNADDDNFLTRWMMNNKWKIYIQKHRECEVQTTLEGNIKFLLQCLRWARSNWRSNVKSLCTERTVWRRHPWSTYAVFQTTLTSWSFLYDPILAWSFWTITTDLRPGPQIIARTVVFLWIFLLCRLVKYLEHFTRYPGDLKFLPLIPFFGYFHSSFIKLQAMLTLHVTTWGSREGADANDSYRMIRLPGYVSTRGPSKTEDALLQAAEDKHETSDDTAPLLPRYADN